MTGMIQKVEATEAEVTTPEAQEENGHVEWYWDDNTPGQGNRPDWLATKYNKVSDQAKAQRELEKMLGTGGEVPTDYDLSQYADMFDLENPAIANLKNKAKEYRLGQEAVSSVLDSFAEYQKSLMPDVDAEIAKLGEHANTRLKTLNTWASNHLSDKALETLGNISNTADFVEMMDEIRQLHVKTASKVPTGHAPVKAEVITPEMVQQEIITNYERYQADPAYRRQIESKMALAVGEE